MPRVGALSLRARAAPRVRLAFSPGQAAAVRAAFALAGFDGEIVTMPVESEDERIFVVPQDDLMRMADYSFWTGA